MNPDETERTYIVTATVRQCLQEAKVDFTTLGLIMQAILSSEGLHAYCAKDRACI